jgi:hypothetical protein
LNEPKLSPVEGLLAGNVCAITQSIESAAAGLITLDAGDQGILIVDEQGHDDEFSTRPVWTLATVRLM